MTITYSLNVSEARLCGFPKLLLRWRGSIYKLLYREMVIFIGLYFLLSITYRYVLDDIQKRIFEDLAKYCEKFTDLIPLSFVLGFYVSIVVGRWWQQYMNVPWPDKTVMSIAAYVHGGDERGRIIRRTLARYLSLLSALTFQGVSTAVKKRFPTLDHMEEAGLMTKEERRVYEDIPVSHGKWWVPAQWFVSLAVRARKEGRIKDDILLKHLLDEMHVFRGCCGMLFSYDWISIPLVYTQVVTLAIYTYFLASVMGRQYVHPKNLSTDKNQSFEKNPEIDLYIPIFTILQFFFYMGWLKVAEQLINPFGEDDDDFELNWCLDRNLQVSFNIVDDMYQRHPRLVRDIYWDEAEPQLPYTKSSVNLRTQPHLGSAMTLDVDPEEAEFVPMETILEEDNEEHKYNSPPTSPTSELLSPNFPAGDGKSPFANEGDNVSQGGLRFPSDFPGSKFLNMIIGSSSENVCQTPKKEHNFLPSFMLKTPARRSRTSSLAEGLNHHNVNDKKEEMPSSHDSPWKGSLYGNNNTVEERKSLILNIIPDESPSDNVTVDVEPSTAEEDLAVKTGEGEVGDKDDKAAATSAESKEKEESPYEPNSSQESLMDNQSTVSSYAELLQHSQQHTKC